MRFFARRLTDRHCKNIIDRQPRFLYNLLVMNKPPTTSHEYIYTQIRQRIRLGVYQSGSKLSENKLAKEFNCSRVPVRETFLRLQQEGLVTIQPQSGTYVRTYTLEDYRNALEVRAYLESLAAALVIEKNSPLDEIEAAYGHMQQIIDGEPFDLNLFGEYHYTFHRTLVCLSENNLLIETYDRLHFQAIQQIFFRPMTRQELLVTHQEHRQLLDCIAQKDPYGPQLALKHLWERKRASLAALAKELEQSEAASCPAPQEDEQKERPQPKNGDRA